MSAGNGARTVTTRYAWMPHGSTGGWLLVHRSIVPGGTHDFWITGEISPEDATDVLKDTAEGWEPLVLGEPVSFLLWPFVLTAATGKQLRRIREQLLVTRVRPLADIRVTVADTPAGRVVSQPAVILADDPFAPGHADLDLGDDWETGPLDAEARRVDLLAAVESKLEPAAAGVRHRVPVNRFVALDDHARPALDDILARRAIRAALAALLADPADDDLRERLVDELRGHGWHFDSSPLPITGEPKPGFLERLVFILASDGPDQPATYRVATLPGPAAALDPALLTVLAGYLCPLDPALRSTPEDFRAALTTLGREWDTPRERGLHLAPPAGEEIVTVRGPGPVPVGTPPREEQPLSQIAEIHHVELFDSQGLPRGTFDLSAAPVPAQPADGDELPTRMRQR